MPVLNDIAHNYAKGVFDATAQYFLPEGKIESLVTALAIKKEAPKLSEDIIRWILRDAKKLFVIGLKSLHSNPDLLKPALERFKEIKFDDSSIPITSEPPEDNEDDETDASDKQIWESFGCKGVWGRQHLIAFHQEQWKYFAPVFEDGIFHYELSAHHILPVTWKHKLAHEGGFATVHKVEMHEAHQRIGPKGGKGPYKTLAIKAILLGHSSSTTDEIWEREAKALSDTNTIDDKHIIKCLAAIRRGDDRYFVFPWADGGTLRDYWNESPQHSRRPNVIKEAVEQLHGIANALVKLHNFKEQFAPSSQKSMPHPVTVSEPDSDGGAVSVQSPDHEVGGGLRHGDLKPENILRFIEDETDQDSELCTLKIADMGLAKRHILATRDRHGATTTIYASRQYESPERERTEPLSRLYDVWSMGCISLDYIIWILYGNDELARFNDEIKSRSQIPRYFHIPDGEGAAIISPGVQRWMDFIRIHDPECQRGKDSAIKDLLHIIQTQLLVPSKSKGPTRAKASQFRDELGKILVKMKKAEQDGHAYALVAPNLDIIEKVPPSEMLLTPGAAIHHDRSFQDDDQWYFPIDNDFTRQSEVANLIRTLTPKVDLAHLCDRCRHLSFWTANFSFVQDKASDLESKTKCEFCQMLWGICKANTVDKNARLVFRRDKSVLKMEVDLNSKSWSRMGNHPSSIAATQRLSGILQGRDPVISLLRDRALKLDSIQIGLPRLPLLQNGPDGRPKEFFELIRLWLQDCDEKHFACRGTSTTRLPTRLIHVGKSKNDKITLYETTEDDQIQHKRFGPNKYSYVALSHRWGDIEECRPFVTLPETLAMFKKDIPSSGDSGLPPTFQHAVEVTRGLGKEYLWIDSICILQGPKGDFKTEAERMGDVFSSAYCVIAASRAVNQRDGFLKAREERKFLKFQTGAGKPFYACESIDDFKRDVLDGPLNKRGWVLQERALARRTIYFTKVQTYFECGEGVRSETLSKIRQTEAEFLGDPNFPQKIKHKTRGVKIRDFTGLYQQYSRLEMTRPDDRPRAIQGLESRLGSAYGAQVRFGIFDGGPDKGFFHRSLLWKRADDRPMEPIKWGKDRYIHVPTWSWMDFIGAIEYLSLDGNQFDWEKADIHPPWTVAGRDEQSEAVHLKATVRRFDIMSYQRLQEQQASITYDMQVNDGPTKGECVIVARTKDGGLRVATTHKKYYILVVSPTSDTATSGEAIFKRIGVGCVLDTDILWSRQAIAARIC